MLRKSLFLKINIITLGSVFVLILVGSIVRSLGAGMGCPDWPKCFGEYVPPTSNEGLPSNYQEIFKDQRIKKNERLARTFASLGYAELSEKITNDPSILKEHDFDVTKAWIEYINRLVGVLIGLLVFLNMIFAFGLRKENKWIPFFGVFIFVLTGFQGWVGSLVVSTNLLHGFITFHMILALLIVALLIVMNLKARDVQRTPSKPLFWLSLILFLLFIPQIFLGTDVRGIIDDLISTDVIRSSWADSLTTSSFYFHRSYSWVLLIGAAAIFYLGKKNNLSAIMPSACALLLLVGCAMIIGVGMTWFSFPFWLQPLHLIVATGIFSLLFYLTLRLKIS